MQNTTPNGRDKNTKCETDRLINNWGNFERTDNASIVSSQNSSK